MLRIRTPRLQKISCEQLVIFSYCLWVMVNILNSTQFKNIWGWTYITKGTKFLCLGLVVLSVLMKKTIKAKVLYAGLALAVVGMVIALVSDRASEVMLVIAFVVSGWHITSDKILRRYIVIVLSVILFTLFLYGIDVYDFDSYSYANRVRLYLGFTYTTQLPNLFFHFLLVYFVVRKRWISVFETVFIVAINFIIWRLTDTNAVYYGIYLLLLLLWGLRLFPRIYQSKLFRIGTLGIMPILAVLAIWLSYIYTPSNVFLLALNKVLNTRLSLGHQAIERYGFTLFGNETAWVTGRYGIERTEAYFYVDSSYLNIALSFGFVTLILVIIGFVFLSRKAIREKKYVLCIVLIMLAVHSFGDPQLFDLKYDPFLILIGTAVLQKGVLPLNNAVETVKRVSIRYRRKRSMHIR